MIEERFNIVKQRSQCIKKYSHIRIIDDLCVLIAEFATHSKYNEFIYNQAYHVQNDQVDFYNIPLNLISIKYNIKVKNESDIHTICILENMEKFLIIRKKYGFLIKIKSSCNRNPTIIYFGAVRCNNTYDSKVILNVNVDNIQLDITIS